MMVDIDMEEVKKQDLLYSETLPWTIRERMKAVSAIMLEFCVLAIFHPAFREEVVWPREVVGAAVHDSVGNA